MFRILGIETVDYVSKKTGNRVTGTRLHCMDGQSFNNTVGNRVYSIFVPSRVNTSDLAVNDDVEVIYNRFGTCEDVRRIG